MSFNLSKYVTLKCYKSLSPILTDYCINEHKLENVKQLLLGNIYRSIVIHPSHDSIKMSLVKLALLKYSISSSTNVLSVPNQIQILALFDYS